MQAILSYIIFVINSLVDLLSIQIFPDFPVTVFQFLCSIVIITYLFRFIFGGTKEFDSFANISIRDVSRSMNNNSRKEQILQQSFLHGDYKRHLKVESKPIWFNRNIKSVPLSDDERAEMESIIHSFD